MIISQLELWLPVVDIISFSVLPISLRTIPLVKICSRKKKTISRGLLSRRNRLKWENTPELKAVLAKKITLMRRIFCRALTMRRHEMMSASLIFRVNCSEASFFTIRFFHFQVHFPSKRELFFELNKETSCEIYKARK